MLAPMPAGKVKLISPPILQRYTFIDSLRGLAACSVALFHFNEIGVFSTSLYQTVVSYG
jgi:peptidoglycan/LPS O-acetylase OafA/YrhL